MEEGAQCKQNPSGSSTFSNHEELIGDYHALHNRRFTKNLLRLDFHINVYYPRFKMYSNNSIYARHLGGHAE